MIQVSRIHNVETPNIFAITMILPRIFKEEHARDTMIQHQLAELRSLALTTMTLQQTINVVDVQLKEEQELHLLKILLLVPHKMGGPLTLN